MKRAADMKHLPTLISPQIGFDAAQSTLKRFGRHDSECRDAAIAARSWFECDANAIERAEPCFYRALVREPRDVRVKEYVDAIEPLMQANVFPGDMRYKNFGATRHGRAMFHDADETGRLADGSVRKVPAPRNEEDELPGEPWYTVGPHNILPKAAAPSRSAFRAFAMHSCGIAPTSSHRRAGGVTKSRFGAASLPSSFPTTGPCDSASAKRRDARGPAMQTYGLPEIHEHEPH
jgi:hypothetical protein